jgi:undecaprenol kinase
MRKPQHSLPAAFACAGRGVMRFARGRNAQLQLLCAILTLVTAAFVQVSDMEWIVIILCITGVLTTEAVNTAIERAVDLTTTHLHPIARDAKDIAAGAVLIACCGAATIGVIILGPKMLTKVMAFMSATAA